MEFEYSVQSVASICLSAGGSSGVPSVTPAAPPRALPASAMSEGSGAPTATRTLARESSDCEDMAAEQIACDTKSAFEACLIFLNLFFRFQITRSVALSAVPVAPIFLHIEVWGPKIFELSLCLNSQRPPGSSPATNTRAVRWSSGFERWSNTRRPLFVIVLIFRCHRRRRRRRRRCCCCCCYCCCCCCCCSTRRKSKEQQEDNRR